jgi:hypothetical protein
MPRKYVARPVDTKVFVGADPTPSVIVSGIASTRCEASNSPVLSLSRTIAQPGVRASFTSKPSF